MKVFFTIIILLFSFCPILSLGKAAINYSYSVYQEDTLTAHTDSVLCVYPVYVSETVGFKCGIDSFTSIIEGIDGNYIEITYLLKSEKGAMEIIWTEYKYVGLHSELKMIYKSHSYFREGNSLKTCMAILGKSDGSNRSYKKIKYYQPIPTGIWQSWDENGKMTETKKE